MPPFTLTFSPFHMLSERVNIEIKKLKCHLTTLVALMTISRVTLYGRGTWYHTLMEQTEGVWEQSVDLYEECVECWRKFQKECHNLCYERNIIRSNKSSSIKWACDTHRKNQWSIQNLAGKPKCIKYFWTSNCKQENNIKMDLKYIDLEWGLQKLLKIPGLLLMEFPLPLRAVGGKTT